MMRTQATVTSGGAPFTTLPANSNDAVTALAAVGALSALDAELARSIGRLAGEEREAVLLAFALASRATSEGHVCAELARIAGTAPLTAEGEPTGIVFPTLEAWCAAIAESPAVGDGTRPSAFVLDAEARLYLYRYHEHEARLGAALRARSSMPLPLARPEILRTLVPRLFGAQNGTDVDWQRIAAQIACVSSFSVVSGGPGTGKTSTVIRLLALSIADLQSQGNARPRVLLLAPTGKAAARLADATARAKATLDCPQEVLDCIPTEARTVHRALEAGRDGRFRIGPDRLLLADIVAVDEASMIDVALMRHLVEAVPATARLVLLGDRHQLSSVEAGAVLADVCGTSDSPHFSAALASRVRTVFGEELPAAAITGGEPSIDDAVVTLVKSHRFSESSPLGALARAIQQGRTEDALALLARPGDVSLVTPQSDRALDPSLRRAAIDGFTPLARSETPEVALGHLDAFRILCAHRTGPAGVIEINRWLARELASAGLIHPDRGVSHPILVTRNDASVDLFNGDVGVVFRQGGDAFAARAVFRTAEGTLRALSIARLPPHEPAFAMSVHKSQGSEFDDVVLVLPRPGSPLLSRELVYTAVTRARRRVTIHGSVEALKEAIDKPVARASGLGDALRKR
jgi:exodeoxyribonuclease V alpha subunit